MRMIKKGDWSDTVRKNGSWSGKLKNPSKRFFLELAATAVRAVNRMRDSCGLAYDRKSMIRCGMALDVSGRWHESQLTPNCSKILVNIASTAMALPFQLGFKSCSQIQYYILRCFGYYESTLILRIQISAVHTISPSP